MSYRFNEGTQICYNTKVNPDSSIPFGAESITDDEFRIILEGRVEQKWFTYENGSIVSHDSVKFWYKDGSEGRTSYDIQEPPNGTLTTHFPSEHYRTHDGTDWIFDISSARQEAVVNISAKRRSLIDSGVTVDGSEIQSDDNSHTNMGCYVSAPIVDDLADVTWECSNGSDCVYTVQALKAVFTAVANFRRECFVRSSELKTMVAASDDPLSIEIETGWPSTILTTV
jgi:hypothetical protein